MSRGGRASRLAEPGDPVSRRQTRAATRAVALVGVIAGAVGLVAQGLPGLSSGLLGAVVALAFFQGGLAPLKLGGLWGEKAGPGVIFLLVNYVFRLVALLLVLVLALAAGVHGRTLGLTIVACALAWVVAQAYVSLRYHDPLDV